MLIAATIVNKLIRLVLPLLLNSPAVILLDKIAIMTIVINVYLNMI